MLRLALVLIVAALVFAGLGGSWSDGNAAAADWSSSIQAPAKVKAPARVQHYSYSNPTGWYCPQYGGYVLAYIDANTAYVCLYHQIYVVHASH